MTLIIYTKQQCPYCVYAKELLSHNGIPYEEIVINNQVHGEMSIKTGQNTVPYIFNDCFFIGGYTELKEWFDLKFSVDYYSIQDLLSIVCATNSCELKSLLFSSLKKFKNSRHRRRRT